MGVGSRRSRPSPPSRIFASRIWQGVRTCASGGRWDPLLGPPQRARGALPLSRGGIWPAPPLLSGVRNVGSRRRRYTHHKKAKRRRRYTHHKNRICKNTNRFAPCIFSNGSVDVRFQKLLHIYSFYIYIYQASRLMFHQATRLPHPWRRPSRKPRRTWPRRLRIRIPLPLSKVRTLQEQEAAGKRRLRTNLHTSTQHCQRTWAWRREGGARMGCLSSWHAGECALLPWWTAAATSDQARSTCKCGSTSE